MDLSPFLRAAGPPQRYPRGTEFFSQGSEAEAVFVLTGGLAKLLRGCPEGRTAIVGTRTTGWILGGAAALLGDPYSVTACAVTQCEALRIGAAMFRDMVRADGQVSEYVHRIHAMEIGSGLVHLGNFGNLTARQRLECFLADLATELTGRGESLEIPLRDWEIAQRVAITPPYLSRLLREMIAGGQLRRVAGALVVNAAGAAAVREPRPARSPGGRIAAAISVARAVPRAARAARRDRSRDDRRGIEPAPSRRSPGGTPPRARTASRGRSR